MKKWQILLGYGHGMAWKLAAQASKLGFVLLVLPTLPSGLYAQYAYISSLALLASLALSFGAIDELPILVEGQFDTQVKLSPLFQTLVILTCFVFFGYFFGGGIFALGAATAGCSISYFFLAGMIRTNSPGQFEIVSNAPSILFLVLCLLVAPQSIEQLLILFIIANISVMCIIAGVSGMLSLPSRESIEFSFTTFAYLFSRGNAKSLSNFLMVADFRALITAPNLLLKVLPSDAFAVALTIGEAFWQLAMVVINRNYARYCMGMGNLRGSVTAATAMMSAFVLIGVILILVPIPLSLNHFSWPMIGWATVFFAAATALTELRAYFWSRKLRDRYIISVQLLILVLQCAIVVTLPMDYWMPVAASSLIICAMTSLALAHLVNRRVERIGNEAGKDLG